MFKERNILPQGSSDACGVALRCIWDVEADPSYDVPVERAKSHSKGLRPKGGAGLIAIRTLTGSGRVCLENDEVIDIPADTLLLVEWDRLTRYHCLGPEWHFWWFEFFAFGPVSIPLYEIIHLPVERTDQNSFDEIQELLLSNNQTHRSMASSKFLSLLYDWFQCYEKRQSTPHEQQIEKVIRRMYDSLDERWTIADMAKEAGMSEVWFRKEFHKETGSSPKKFYDRLRMTWAEEMLRMTPLSISEIADRLGFSSPFHFSRVFKDHFGHPPSEERKREVGVIH